MKIITLFIFVFYFACTFCQKSDFDVVWGSTYKLPPSMPYMTLYGYDETGFHVLRQAKYDERLIEKYDNDMNLIYKEKLILPKRKNTKLNFEGLCFLGKQQIVFASIDDVKERKSYAYAYPINEDGKIGDHFKILDEESNEGRKTVNFDFVLSKDTSKLLVYFNEPFHKYQNESFSFKVYDKTLNKLWEKEVTLPYKDGYFEVGDYKVDNEGNVFVLANIFPDMTLGERSSKTEQSVKPVLFGFNYKTGRISQYELKLPTKWIESITYGFNEEGTEMIVGGYYSDNNGMKINGIFYMTIDISTSKVLKTSIKEFDLEFMEDMIGERKAEKGTGLKNMKFDYFLTKKDGGIFLVSENSVRKNIGALVGGGDYYNDIMVVNVSSEGDIKWIKIIPKKTYDPKFIGIYLSYALSFDRKNDVLSFVFNDNPKNFELFKKDPNKAIDLGEWRYVKIALASINNEGEMTRTPLFSMNDLNTLRLAPRFFLDTGNGIITFAIKGKKYRFGKISFK